MRRARQVWAELIRQYEKSGVTLEEFATLRGIPPKTLRWWHWKLRRDADDEPSLLPVRVIPSTAPVGRGSDDVAAVEVELPDGVRLRFVGSPVDVVVGVLSRLRQC